MPVRRHPVASSLERQALAGVRLDRGLIERLGATYALVSGRYRLAWDTPPDDSEDACERVEVAVVQQDGDFEYVRGSTSARFNATVNDLPQGIYKLEQRDPGCPTWQLRIDWMTN